jgi:hypothetical protein
MAVVEPATIEEGVFYAYGATPGYQLLELDRFREFLKLMSDAKRDGLFAEHSKLILDCLVTTHEREHFIQYQTTIFGGLMWRLFQCLRVDILHLGQMIDRSGSLDGVALPLHTWTKEHGRSHFYAHAPPAEEPGRSVGSVVDMLDEAEEIERFLEFFSVMTGSLTHSETELAAVNAGYRRLAARSGLVPIRGELMAGDPTNVGASYSTAEVMEAGARLAELALLQKCGADAAHIANWQRTHVHGEYKRVLSALLGLSITDVTILKAVVDAALCGPVDLICPELHEPGRPLVDIHPGPRFERLLLALRDTDVSAYGRSSNLAMIGLLDVLCAKARLPRLSKTLRLASQAAFQKGANWGGMRISEKFRSPADLANRVWDSADTGRTSNVISNFERILLTSLERRLSLPCSFMEPAGVGTGLLPVIELFADQCALNPIPGETVPQPAEPGKLDLHMIAFIYLLEQVFCLRAIGKGNLASLMSFAEKLIARMYEGSSAENRRDLEASDLLKIAANELPSAIIKLLNEAHELPFDLREYPVQRMSSFGDWSARLIEPLTPEEIRTLVYLPLLFHSAVAMFPNRAPSDGAGSMAFMKFLQNAEAHESGLLRQICRLITQIGPAAYFENAPGIAQFMGMADHMQRLLARELLPAEYKLTLKELFGFAVDVAVASGKKFLVISQVSPEQRKILTRLAEIFQFDLAELPGDKKAKLEGR